mgnify:CR=1 FL=1
MTTPSIGQFNTGLLDYERIIVTGGPGSGKSYTWLTIATLFPKRTFHVLDLDLGTIRVWSKNFPQVSNVHYYTCTDWFSKVERLDNFSSNSSLRLSRGGVASCFDMIAKNAKQGDWVVIETLAALWNMAQASYIAQVFKQDIGEYFLAQRLELKSNAKSLKALKGWIDWPVVNKLHNDDLIVPIFYKLPVHVFATTTYGILSKESEEEEDIKSFYGNEKIRLEGQKHNPYRAQSMFFQYHFDELSKDGKSKTTTFYIDTFLKDRARPFWRKHELTDFGLEYLVGVAGLTPD